MGPEVSYTLETYDPDDDFDRWYTDATAEQIKLRLDQRMAVSVLEVGCATGRMTARIARSGRMILALDRDGSMLGRAQERDLRGVFFACGDILDVRLMERFDVVVCCSMLHEVDDPQAVLRRCREVLEVEGRVLVTVPSAGSIHLTRYQEFSERAMRFGVRRVYTIGEWHNLLVDGTGLKVVDRFEFVCKPYPNERMECLSVPMLDYLARYRGPGGALCYFELEADDGA